MEALYLKSQGYPHWEIAQLIRVTKPTLLSYFRDYQSGGIAKLKQLTFHQPQSELKHHQESLEAYFHKHPPKTLAQLLNIELLYLPSYSPNLNLIE